MAQAIPHRVRGAAHRALADTIPESKLQYMNDRIGTTLIPGLGSETRLRPIPVTRKSFICRGLGKVKTRILLVLAQAAIISLTLFATAYAGWNSRLFFETATVSKVRYYLSEGASLNARTENGATPLHTASAHAQDPGIVHVLLEAGAEVHARNRYGSTPLHVAAAHTDSPSVIETLLAAGADVHIRARDGATPLHMAAAHNSNPQVIEALLKAGADLAGKDRYGRTPLHVACAYNHNPKIVEMLLSVGADPGIPDKKGRLPIDHAKGNESVRSAEAYRLLNDARF